MLTPFVGKFTWFLLACVHFTSSLPPFVLSSFAVFALISFLSLGSSIGLAGWDDWGILSTYTYEIMCLLTIC